MCWECWSENPRLVTALFFVFTVNTLILVRLSTLTAAILTTGAVVFGAVKATVAVRQCDSITVYTIVRCLES